MYEKEKSQQDRSWKAAARILTCILLSGYALTAYSQKETEKLRWQEERLLTWDDFNGKPEKRYAVASTHYDIIKKTWREGNKVMISVEAIFFRNASWKKSAWVNDFVLTHEQKHFDIVELYARKLRKMLAEARFKDYADLLARAEGFYEIIDKEMDAFQDLYDEESDGSLNGDKQREWNRRISDELDNFKQYKEAVVVLRLEESASPPSASN